jgi:Malectin-like domain
MLKKNVSQEKKKYLIRYPDDPHDRMWEPWSNVPFWTEITTTSHVQNIINDIFEVPSAIFQTAVTPVNSSQLMFYWDTDPLEQDPGYLANLHFSEIVNLTNNATREFNITINDAMWYNGSFTPEYLTANAIYGSRPIHGFQRYNVTLTATTNSTLPPILNAVELFIAMSVSDIPTDSGDGKVLSFITNSISIFQKQI